MDAASTSSKRPGDRRRYAGVFLIALATLMLEVLLTRLTSVVAWYHLAFFVISLAMLGMTAGAVAVFVRPERYADADIGKRIASNALGFALAIPVAITVALALPLEPVTDLMTFSALLLIGTVLAVPFVLGGIALTLALTRSGLPTGIVYGVDLIGAALGCALVVPVLRVIDAPSAAVLSAAIAALAAVCFASAEGLPVRRAWLTALGLLLVVFLNSRTDPGFIRPAWVKGLREDKNAFAFYRWNTYSRITVRHDMFGPPVFWARGRNAPASIDTPLKQRYIEIDGAAGTVMVENGREPKKHSYLSWDVTAAAHVLRPTGPAAVIGVGGGRDVLEAVRMGHSPVVGVEINDLIVSLHKNVMRDFSGIADLPDVRLVTDEARSYMARDKQLYSVITMSLIDTWASTGAGAYSLSENGLYTVEAWKTFASRLTQRGIFTVSRWYVVDSPGETARMLALAMETLWSMGVQDPRKNIILLQADKVATLLLSRSAYSEDDIDLAQKIATHKGFNMLLTPRRDPAHPLLRKLVKQKSRAAMHAFAASQPLDLTPPTDQRPFFFNMLKPLAWFGRGEQVRAMDMVFLGNLAATQTLLYATLVSLLLSFATLIVPMTRRVDDLRALPRRDVLAALSYFALIGLGFMLVEIGILSRLSVFLGHPTLALSVLLSGIILFTGVGSMLSGRIDVTNPRWAMIYPWLTALGVLTTAVAMEPVMASMESAPAATRISASLALLVMPALGMGLCFPLGLRLTERMETAHTGQAARLGPWLWGINGAFSVCASGLALGCSMVFGIRTTLLTGMICYVLLPLATRRLVKSAS
jgi:spermidine synthase